MSASHDSLKGINAVPPPSRARRGQIRTPSRDDTVVRRRPPTPFGYALTLEAGDWVAGRFRILGLLGRGAMGEVYRAEDSLLGENVALKVLPADAEETAVAVKRFLKEIRLGRRISHPNVCRVFDSGLDRGNRAGGRSRSLYFFTMELLEGETLGHRLQRQGRMGVEEARPILRQVAEGLAAAHGAGVVHRDLKSENILLVLSEPGAPARVVVMDFGLARTLRWDEWTPITHGLLGTPAYMAPEQVEGGRAITPAADVYALGVVLYQMLTDALPFHGGGPFETALKRLTHDPPPPSRLVPDLDPRWEDLILRCLARDPAHRFATARDVLDALPAPGAPAAARGEALVPWGGEVVPDWGVSTLALDEAPTLVPAEEDTTALPWPGPVGPRDSITDLVPLAPARPDEDTLPPGGSDDTPQAA